jgi:sugar phosphate isomerase/epimerase
MTLAEQYNGELSLCWGTLEEADFTTFTAAAAGAGYRAVTLNTVLCEDARKQGLSNADIASTLADHGLVVSNIDPTPGWLPLPQQFPGDAFFSRLSRCSVDQVFELAHAVGTDLINAPAIFSGVESEHQVVEAFGELCRRAAAEGLRVSLEFMPITLIRDLPSAARVVTEVNADNGGILFDCWHFRRTGGTVEDLQQLPAEKYFALQLDDVTETAMEDVNEETLNHRLLPGEGAGDVAELLRALQGMGTQMIYDVEVFNEGLRAFSFDERAQATYQAARQVLNQL